MSAAAIPADRRHLLAATGATVFVGTMVSILVPFFAPLFVVGGLAMQAMWVTRDHGDLAAELRRVTLPAVWLTLLAFVGYLALRLVGEPVALGAMPGVASLAIFSACVLYAGALLPAQADDVRSVIGRTMLWAFVLAGIVQAIEVSTGFALRRLVWTWAPMFRPDPAKLKLDGAMVREAVVYVANPTTTVLAALFWPMLLLARVMPLARRARVIVWIGAALAAYAIVRSSQATSKVAMAGGGIIWLVAYAAPKAARPVVMAAWVASCLLVVPATLAAYHQGLYARIPEFSFAHRIVLWGVTAERTLEHPILGIGTGRTPFYDASTVPDVAMAPGTRFPVATNRHAHNVFLQVWYEDGAVGVALLLAAGVMLALSIGRQAGRTQPYLWAAFVGGMLASSFSYSLLASWFIAAIAAGAMVARFALEYAQGAARGTGDGRAAT